MLLRCRYCSVLMAEKPGQSVTNTLDVSRRDTLKRLGVAGAVLTTPVRTVAAESDQTRLIRPDSSGYDALDEVVVTITESGNTRVDMSGTRSTDVRETKGYRTQLVNAQTSDGRLTPQLASATVVELPSSMLPKQKTDQPGTSSEADSGSGTASSGGSGNNESDKQGGVWARTEDPIDITLTQTDHWIEWTTADGDVDWVKWNWKAEWHSVESPPAPPSLGKDTSIWKSDDHGHCYTDFEGNAVESKASADYYNWTWGHDKNKTTTHHRIIVEGNPDGSLGWQTSHWHTGEDAMLLHVDVGIHGDDR